MPDVRSLVADDAFDRIFIENWYDFIISKAMEQKTY